MAFSMQDTRDQTRLAKIADEGFALIDHFLSAKTNQHKKPPTYHHQPQLQLSVYHCAPQVYSTSVKLTPRVDQTRLRKIAEDGFRVIDEVYGKKNHRNYQQAACVQYGTQAITVQERAANSNVETARFYGGNETITSDEIYGGFMVNEYGNPKY